MDDIRYEKLLNRIIQGRLRLRVGDLVLYIEEPSNDIIEESFDVYEDALEKAYFAGCYVDREVLEVLVEQDLWSPIDEKNAKEFEKNVEDLKVEAFQSFFQESKLRGIKRNIRMTERKRAECLLKKQQLDHLSCKGVASFSRNIWLVSKTCKDVNGNLFDFNNVSIKRVMDLVAEAEISVEDMRYVARNAPWRQMWTGSRKRDSVFDKCAINLDKNQLALISFSQMYDNVYESPDQPPEEVINDDDALDGWFISERRKHEADKKQRAIDSKLSNSKIANSQEIMLMANNQEEANEIFDLNDGHARNVVRQRQNQIQEQTKDGGTLHFKDLHDVKQDRMIHATSQGINTIRGMKGK